jgi:hypothetical protein
MRRVRRANPEPDMISRLTASAALFAILSAATIVFAANPVTHQDAIPAAAAALPVVQLAPVTVIGRRTQP